MKYTLRQKKTTHQEGVTRMGRKSIEVMYMYRKTNDYSLRKIGWFTEVIEASQSEKSVTRLYTSGLCK